MEQFEAYIAIAQVLIGLGITTAAKIKEVLKGTGHDDETLQSIVDEATARLERHKARNGGQQGTR